jgi:ribose transport system substrate-binding protein
MCTCNPSINGDNMKRIPLRRLLAAASATLVLALSVNSASAQGKGLEDPNRAAYRKALAGKTVAYVPMSMAYDLAVAWHDGLKRELEPLGVKIVTRDPNFNTNAGAQALTALISEKPDVIIANNADVQTYARLLQRAEAAGIYVLQINMNSNYQSAAYVGADWMEIGERGVDAVAQACQGKSNKIAVVQGALAAAASAYQLQGVERGLARHTQLKVVSSQAADWDANKAKGITQTVLKQHPDLCGIIGFWDAMDVGTAAAIKEAGLTGKVFLVTSGGGEQKGACDQVKAGAFDLNLSYDAPNQGRDMATMIKWLLQGSVKPGVAKGVIYSTLVPITKANASTEGTCWKAASR